MVLRSIGRRGARAVAGLLIAVTTVYVAAWIYYSGGEPAPSARLGITYEFSEATASLQITGVEPGTPGENGTPPYFCSLRTRRAGSGSARPRWCGTTSPPRTPRHAVPSG